MWTIGDDEPEATTTGARSRGDCPGCGEPIEHDDDFCHECGHAFTHFGSDDAVLDGADVGSPCPMCASGELIQLEYGRTQCDSCGYTTRDEG